MTHQPSRNQDQITAFNEAMTGRKLVNVIIDIVPTDLGHACDHMDFAPSAGARYADYLEIKLHNDLKEQGIQSEINVKYINAPNEEPRNDVLASVWIRDTVRGIVDDTRDAAWQAFKQCQTESDWDHLYDSEINRALYSEDE